MRKVVSKNKTINQTIHKKNTRKKKRGFTLIELLAVIVILGLLIMLAIPAVTKYITESRKKTLITTIDSYVRAVTTAVNDNQFGALSNESNLYYIKVSDLNDDSCVPLEKGGKDPFGNWDQAYIVVHYNANEFKYDFYFTFLDEAGYGMALTKSDVISYKGKLINNPSPVTRTNITGQTSAIIERGGSAVPITTSSGVAVSNSNIYVISPSNSCKPESVYIIADDIINNPCTPTVTSLTQGTEYVSGDYTYRYKQSYKNGWVNIDEDGWGVKYTGSSLNTTIDSSICTTIANKPIVSTSNMYKEIKTATSINLSNLDTSRVTDMSYMFDSCFSLNNPDFSHFNTSKVKNMQAMFNLTGIDVPNFTMDLSHFDTSNVENMRDMFKGSGRYTTTSYTLNLSNWNTKKVTTMYGMFDGTAPIATNVNIIGLDNWDTRNVENMTLMFARLGGKAQRFDINLSRWNVSNVNNMGQMFDSAGKESNYWSVGDLSNWDTRNVTNMTSIFNEAGMDATTWNSIGRLKVYASNYNKMFYNAKNAKATLVIYKQPGLFKQVFTNASTVPGSLITVDYSRNVTSIDAFINTKSSESNVFKGSQID